MEAVDAAAFAAAAFALPLGLLDGTSGATDVFFLRLVGDAPAALGVRPRFFPCCEGDVFAAGDMSSAIGCLVG